MTIAEIKNTPEIVDFMISESVIPESKEKLHKRLDEICNLAVKALEQCEVWEGIHGQVIAPKGTFDRIWEDAEKEEQEQKTEWIPVSERLPEKYGNYLVTVDASDGTATITFQMVEHFGPAWLHEDKWHKVTAWMPLPEPYKEG